MRMSQFTVATIAGAMSFVSAVAPAVAQDAASGERLFRQRCAACHSTDAGRNLMGPHLVGVVGRDIAGVEGARYSPGLRSLEGVWAPEQLDAFLANPRGTAPGTTMTISVSNEAQRTDLIAFLGTLTSD